MSELKLVDYKHIDIKVKNLVDGYIHDVQSKIPDDTYYNIPPLVHMICALFYDLTDKYDESRIGSVYEINGNEITATKPFAKSAYLENIVSSGRRH